MGIFTEPCCLTQAERDWKEQAFPQSKRQLSPAAYNLFYSPLSDTVEEEQKCCTLHMEKEDHNASCRGTKMDPLATFFTHMFTLSFNSNIEHKYIF